jgi:glycogen synthase
LNGMAQDFSWKASAAQYSRLYSQAQALRGPRQATRIQKPVATSN